jgi:hypothetical protein
LIHGSTFARANAVLLLAFFAPLMWAQRSTHAGVQRTSLRTAPEAHLLVRGIKIHGAKDFVEIEVDTSDRITPQPQMLAGPDRLVLDFPNAVPGAELRSQSIYVGAVKDIRAALFRSKPPITRLVIDLDGPETYQIFPAGRTVMIKMSTTVSPSAAAVDPWREPAVQTAAASISPPIQVIAPAAPVTTPVEPPKPSLEVQFVDGLLSIKADRVTLAEILRGVQQRTGAQVSIAPGAEQEKVVSNLGPAPAQEVLAHLLNGSKFNFLILNAAGDPKKLDRVILTPRTDGGPATLPPLQTAEQPQSDPAMPPPAAGQPNAPTQVPDDPNAVTRPEFTMPPDADAPQ